METQGQDLTFQLTQLENWTRYMKQWLSGIRPQVAQDCNTWKKGNKKSKHCNCPAYKQESVCMLQDIVATLKQNWVEETELKVYKATTTSRAKNLRKLH